MSKILRSILFLFDYFEKSLIALSVIKGNISVAPFGTVIGATVGMTSASYSLAFSFSTGIVKKLLKKPQEIRRKYTIKLLC